MIAVEAARFHVQSLLARGLALSGSSGALGITGASEIWGALAPRDKAGWYVWLRGRAGAYGLDLEDAGIDEGPGEPLCRAQLSIRHYPSPRDPCFGAFSADERAIASGDWLDATGAPDVLRASSIPPGLFVIGALELAFQAGGPTRALSLAAPERLREVPAWELAAPLFAALGAFVAQVERRSATRLVECVEPTHRAALLLLDPRPACRRGPLPCLDPDAHVVRDVALDGGVATAPIGTGSVEISAGWFVAGAAPLAQLGCCR